jgi:putative ABC transport system ATP-binding protein
VSTIGVNSIPASRPQQTSGNPDDVVCSSFIEIEHLTKVFRSNDVETRALSEIRLSIRRGEYVALSGPSGCGKSTLLSIIGLLDTPTSGRYLLDGRDTSKLSYTELSAIRNQEIGFVFQSFNLIEEMTVYENVALPLSYRRGMTTTELKQRVYDSLTRVEMDDRARHYPAQLSGGQQQRIAVARALAGSPSLLLADEPTGNLDSENGDAVMGLLDALHSDGTTICIVTHDPKFAACAQRQITLFDGKSKTEE